MQKAKQSVGGVQIKEPLAVPDCYNLRHENLMQI